MMLSPVLSWLPPEVYKLGLVLFLSFLIGLEREEHHLTSGRYLFGGVRTYPLIGLLGYSLAALANGDLVLLAAGLLAIAALLTLSYWHKLQHVAEAGLTSEIAALTTYLVGALVYFGNFWVASALVVISLILLELKEFLEGLAQRFSSDDILTFTKFLFLSIVILPILPNRAYGPFGLNPFKTWLIVVAVSGISYGSFLLQRTVKGRSSILLTALVGGAYSSTVTTVALAKRSASDACPARYAGGILIASGVMYVRLALLVYLFNLQLAQLLVWPFGALTLMALGGGSLWARRAEAKPLPSLPLKAAKSQNPLELRAAFVFALLFVGILMLTHYTVQVWGQSGLYPLAAIMGLADVDPFILGLTQSSQTGPGLLTAARAILIAAASNNLAKGVYAFSFGERQTGRQSLGLMLVLALAGLLPIVLMR